MPPPSTTEPPRAANGRFGLEALGVAVGALVLYALTRSETLILSHDSLTYLLQIESGRPRELFWHPHHLLFAPLARLWLGAGRALGLAGDPAAAIALLNGIAGATAAGFAYALLRGRARLPRPLALAATVGAATSFGFWFYSASVEVYLLPLALLLATLFVALSPRIAPQIAIAVGLLHGLAMLFHQVHVLFGPVVLVALWQHRRQMRAWRGAAARYVAAGALVVVAGYGAVALGPLGLRSPAEGWDWFTLYAHGGEFVEPLGASTPVKAAVGLGRSVVGGHFAFALPAVRAALERGMPGFSLVDEAYLVRGLDPWQAGGLLALAALAGLALATSLALGLVRARRLPAPAARVAVPLALWLAIYAAFFLVWEPMNVEFWIPQTTALWLLAALLAAPTDGEAARATRRRRLVLAVAAVLIAVVNGLGSIGPASDARNDVWVSRLGPLAREVGAGDLVVVGRPHIGLGYVRRLTAAEGVSPLTALELAAPPPANVVADRLVRQIERALASGHRVVLLPEAVEPDRATLERFGGDARHVAGRLRAAFGDGWAAFETATGYTCFRLEPEEP